MSVTISEVAFGLIVAEGQLGNAIKEERRWALREQEAREMRQKAHAEVLKWDKRMHGLTNIMCQCDNVNDDTYEFITNKRVFVHS